MNKRMVVGTPLVSLSQQPLFAMLENSTLIHSLVNYINHVLVQSGVPERLLLGTNELIVALVTIVSTVILYHYFVLKYINIRTTNKLHERLLNEQEKIALLEAKLLQLQNQNELKNYSSSGQKLEGVRVFMDGAFDMMHYGHMNAFRLARSLGAYLIVGVNSDESITQCKGPPLMNDDERMTMVKGCKFIDEVIPNCPYIMNEKYLNYILDEYNVDYVIHGDDPCIVDGKDVYETAKRAGKYKSIPRTEGVSTTDIVGRMLLMNKDHHCSNGSGNVGGSGSDRTNGNRNTEESQNGIRMNQLLCQQSNFLTTSRLVRLFCSGMKAPLEGMKIIYIDGDFDMFHPGHVTLLEAAKKRGDYLIVGVHGDALVNEERGCNLPLMNLHERVLSVLGCKFVDDVLIDAPQIISRQMIQSLKIDEVVHCTYDENSAGDNNDDDGDRDNNDYVNLNEHPLRYQYAKEAGIFVELKPPSNFKFSSIIERIQANQTAFQTKITRKKKLEEDFYSEKYKSRNR